MYRGFDLKINPVKDSLYLAYNIAGKQLFEENAKKIRPLLRSFILNDKSLDGSAIQNTWFPQVKTDIFLSHSHQNLDLAFYLAGYLSDNFDLNVFIDSCIWGYSDDLLKEIDNDYCMTDKDFYSYKLRNHSTSHIHMMLSTALNMMIDRTECLFFLNTPDSIKSYGSIDKTESPWIYAEISATHYLRENLPKRKQLLLECTAKFSEGGVIQKAVSVTHNLDLSKLNKLDKGNLDLLKSLEIKGTNALDLLYELHPPLNKKSV